MLVVALLAAATVYLAIRAWRWIKPLAPPAAAEKPDVGPVDDWGLPLGERLEKIEGGLAKLDGEVQKLGSELHTITAKQGDRD